MTDTPARGGAPADVPGRAEAAQRESSLHERAVSNALRATNSAIAMSGTFGPQPTAVLAYTLAVLTAFPAMRAALEEAMRWNLVDYGPCVCREPVGMHTDRCKAFNAALRAARAVEQP